MTNPAPGLKSLFDKALELDSPEDRSAYLEDACVGNPALRAEVERLLRAHGKARDFLETPAMSTFSVDDNDNENDLHFAEHPGSIIGPYKLLHEIGEGGMGVVFMAEQRSPIHRRVALKIIKPGMDTRQVIARFEAERQALAMMDHPNIAKVFDAGATDKGHPYFVMELVKGTPITDYCDAHSLTPRERLELLIPVCHAIQHAHQKGIIHRDVKPSNVLIANFDGMPVPKVIDFGIAKAVDHRLTELTLYTRHGAIVGTPLYMSPEQAEDSALNVDTRTDVYSLGVLLYELLTGTTPLEKHQVQKAGVFEILRRIREEEPPKLSSRLSKTKELAAIAARRKIEPAKLTRLVRGELDWIALKALDKDRNRRYESANELAKDLQRYLADQPVEAVPPSFAYQVWKYSRKHRVALATVGAFAAVLIAATAISLWQAVRATNEQAKARRSDADSTAVLEFFRENVLAAARPEGKDGGLGYEVKLHTAIDKAEPTIAKDFANRPTVEAAIRDTLGTTYMYLGRPVDAIKQHERALELRTESLGPGDPLTLTSMNNLAVALGKAGRAAEAVPLHQRELAYSQATLGRDHPETLKSMNGLAVALRHAGRIDEAIPLFEEVLKLRTAKLGPRHQETLTTLNNLAVAYRLAGRAAEAIALHERDLEQTRKDLGADHPDTLTIMDNLGGAYLNNGRVDDAMRLFAESLKLCTNKLGLNHPQTLASRNGLAVAYQIAGRTSEAIRMLQEVVALRSEHLPPNHPATLQSKSSLALAHQEAGRIDVAIPMLEEVLGLRTAKLGEDHPETLKSMNDLAGAYLEAQRWADAEKMLRSCLALREKQTTADWRLYLTMSQLGAALATQKKYAEAEPMLVRGYEGMEGHKSEIPAHRKKDLSAAGARIVAIYEACGKPKEAEVWRGKVE
jgi:eukaryotic-like serine/threonine-protein kinase